MAPPVTGFSKSLFLEQFFLVHLSKNYSAFVIPFLGYRQRIEKTILFLLCFLFFSYHWFCPAFDYVLAALIIEACVQVILRFL